MASGTATVKSVVSGDTLVLVGKATNGPPPEISITLAHVQCPKIARGPSQVDEPFAWESREFLRNLAIGKTVSFKVTQTALSINRTFGDVTLNGVPLVKSVVERGWASLKDNRDQGSNAENDALYEDLKLLNEIAKANNLGIYDKSETAKKSAVRTIDWTIDAKKYHDALTASRKSPAGAPIVINAVVEHVRDGASFRCYVPADSCYVSFAFAGATAPRVNTPSGNSSEASKKAEPEPFAIQSKLFTEFRLLNRRVDLAVQGVSSGKGEAMLLGTVLHAKGNITVEVLRAGLGRVADWTLALLPKEGVIALREAENAAKRDNRGVWADYVPPPLSPHLRTFEAVVVEIISGDTISVLEGQTEQRVTFSSIRVPRQQAKGAAADPFAVECKEFVRQKLIGKSVTVSVEYQRGEGRDVRQFGSVYYVGQRQGGQRQSGRMDIAAQLVQEGLAVTVRHRGDEPRAAGYDMLLVDEVEAVLKKKGMHGPQKASAGLSNDITTDPKKAKAYYATLSKDKTYKGVVEHVFTGSRFKISIPSENVTLQLALSQVRTPQVTKQAAVEGAASSEEQEEGEVLEHPLARWVEEGKLFSRRNFLQRKVDVEIFDIDRNGILLGRVCAVVDGKAAAPVAVTLVQQGLASVDKFASRRGGSEVSELLELQAQAQAEKRGMWIVPNAVPVTQKEAEEEDVEEGRAGGEAGNEDAAKNLFRVNLTEIYDGARFAVNFVDQPNASDSALLRGQMKLAEMEEMMGAFAREQLSSGDSEAEVVVAKGGLLAAYHDNPSAEGAAEQEKVWLRASVEERPDKGEAKVLFVDYGHRAVVPVKSLRGLPEPLKHYAPQAVECSLAFIRSESVETEVGLAAARALNSLAWGKPCLIKVHAKERVSGGRDKGGAGDKQQPAKLEVSLFALESFSEEHLARATNVGVKLVRYGFLRISATQARRVKGGARPNRRGGNKSVPHVETTNETLRELEVAQELAHKEHLRMWAYGHPGDSDDEEDKKEELKKKEEVKKEEKPKK